jgi:hypothetical protein
MVPMAVNPFAAASSFFLFDVLPAAAFRRRVIVPDEPRAEVRRGSDELKEVSFDAAPSRVI